MDVRRALGHALALQCQDLSLEWHRQLQRRLGISPERVFPGDPPRQGIPGVIEWIAARLDDESSPAELADQLRPLIQLRREQGHFLEELLLEFRMLGHILADALVAEIDADHPDLPPGRAARIGAELGQAMVELLSVVGSLYREEELATERTVSRKLDEYSRILTHELIDPLSSADLASQALTTLDLNADERLREIAERVQSAVRGAARVEEGVRALTLAHDQESAPRRAEPLPGVVLRALDTIRAAAAEAGIEIELADEIPEIEVDGARIEIVLRNLLMNALKYADPDKSKRWVRVRVDVEGNDLVVEVKDNGVGIAPEQQARIFDRFYRAEEEAVDGHGLGLAIAREAVQQLRGEIRCESEPGIGSTFSFSIPTTPRESVAAH